MGSFENALEPTIEALKLDENDEKSLYLKAKCLA